MTNSPSIMKSLRAHRDGWLFVSPLVLGFGLFFFVPLISVFFYSASQWNLLSKQSTFVGLANYTDVLFRDGSFWKVLGNSLTFTAGLVPLNMALALVLALALTQPFRGRVVFRTIFFAPVVTAGVAWAIVWGFLLQAESGAINQMLAAIGIQGPNWLRDPNWAMFSVVVTRVFKSVGLNMLLYMAALQSIPRELYEAARMDGAKAWGRFWHITWPMLAPMTLLVAIVTTVGSLKVFDHIYLMTRGGPENATLVLAFYIYQQAFNFFQIGYASALAVVLLFLCAGLASLQWLISRRTAQ